MLPDGKENFRRIELVLPMLISNGERGSDFVRARTGLIASINRFCDSDFVTRLSIIVPEGDVPTAEQLISDCKIKVDVISETALVPVSTIGDIPLRGWFIQQFIKLAYSRICETEFYVTLDSDVFIIKPLNASVFRDGLAPAKLEPTAVHPTWWETSAKALEYPKSAADFDPENAFGVTPQFLKAEIVRSAIDRLERIAVDRGEGNWINYLCKRASISHAWTEYSLYWTQLINNHDPKTIHYPYDVYLYTHYAFTAAKTLYDRSIPHPQLFCVIQSSHVPEESFVEFVSNFLATAPESL